MLIWTTDAAMNDIEYYSLNVQQKKPTFSYTKIYLYCGPTQDDAEHNSVDIESVNFIVLLNPETCQKDPKLLKMGSPFHILVNCKGGQIRHGYATTYTISLFEKWDVV